MSCLPPSCCRRGRILLVGWLLVLSLGALLGLGYGITLLRPEFRRTGDGELNVYCAAGLALPVEVALQNCPPTDAEGSLTIARLGGSGALFGQIQAEYIAKVCRGADLFVSADADLIAAGYRLGIFEAPLPLASEYAVIVVRANVDVPFHDLRSLIGSSSHWRIGIASEQAAIGRLTRQAAEAIGLLP